MATYKRAISKISSVEQLLQTEGYGFLGGKHDKKGNINTLHSNIVKHANKQQILSHN